MPVITAGGSAMTNEPEIDLLAKRGRNAGFGVLAFDYRRLGDSGDHPRPLCRSGTSLPTAGQCLSRTIVPRRAASGRGPLPPPPRLLPGRPARGPRAVPAAWRSRPSGSGRARTQTELVRMPGGHYAPFLVDRSRQSNLSCPFLGRHMLDLDSASAGRSAAALHDCARA